MSILIKRLHYLTLQNQGRVKPLATGCWQWSHAGEGFNSFYNCAGTAELLQYMPMHIHTKKHTRICVSMHANWKKTSYW